MTLCGALGVETVPVLFRGMWSEALLARLIAEIDTERQEGFVIRRADAFTVERFQTSLAKWVRAGHVVSATHWRTAPLVPNGLKGDADAGA